MTNLSHLDEIIKECGFWYLKDEEQHNNTKAAIKSLMLALVENADTASTQGGVYMVAAYDLIRRIKAL